LFLLLFVLVVNDPIRNQAGVCEAIGSSLKDYTRAAGQLGPIGGSVAHHRGRGPLPVLWRTSVDHLLLWRCHVE
jgi:hypothetical protein